MRVFFVIFATVIALSWPRTRCRPVGRFPRGCGRQRCLVWHESHSRRLPAMLVHFARSPTPAMRFASSSRTPTCRPPGSL